MSWVRQAQQGAYSKLDYKSTQMLYSNAESTNKQNTRKGQTVGFRHSRITANTHFPHRRLIVMVFMGSPRLICKKGQTSRQNVGIITRNINLLQWICPSGFRKRKTSRTREFWPIEKIFNSEKVRWLFRFSELRPLLNEILDFFVLVKSTNAGCQFCSDVSSRLLRVVCWDYRMFSNNPYR